MTKNKSDWQTLLFPVNYVGTATSRRAVATPASDVATPSPDVTTPVRTVDDPTVCKLFAMTGEILVKVVVVSCDGDRGEGGGCICVAAMLGCETYQRQSKDVNLG